MSIVDIRLDLDRRPWSDMIDLDFEVAKLERIGLMAGTAPGLPAVYLVALDQRGRTVVVTTTYEVFRLAAKAFAATPTGLEADA